MTKQILIFISIFLIHVSNVSLAQENKTLWSSSNNDFMFSWNYQEDKATVVKTTTGEQIWSGSLLPAFVFEDADRERYYTKASVDLQTIESTANRLSFDVSFEGLAKGRITVSSEKWGISIKKFDLEWTGEIPEIVSLHFGTSKVPKSGLPFLNANELPFVGDWTAAGFCVPGAKEGTAQSYFRMWDFGQNTIALGNFAPSLGTLYGAAFPRPVLAFAMGNDKGWVSFGAGAIPDGAMLLQLQNLHGSITYLYREDLWGHGEKEREWLDPLRITFGENSWSAFRDYFDSFPPKEELSNHHAKSIWNTWGNWKNKEYPIRPMVDFAKKVGAEQFIVDDPWAESQGIGKPSFERFPNFYEDFEYLDENEMQRGIWETLGWITDTAKAGLTSADLILNKDGVPCKSSWSFDPLGSGFYCIDISSERSQKFLTERTKWCMENIKPKIIKLDFGYGMPSPHMGVPRNPQLRGERYCYELLKIIVQAAKEVDPDVTIMFYGINPLYLNLADMVSLDDQGDLWYAMKEGHDQWSTWASLVSNQQVVISGSSSYDWHQDDVVVLNSFILGTPGAVLGTHLNNGDPVPAKYLNRRLAINTFYRRTASWEPVWLNSHVGDLTSPTKINCWGRKEKLDGKEFLSALILDGTKEMGFEALDGLEWQGRWALVSQTDSDIMETKKLALVPFDAGFISIQLTQKPSSVKKLSIDGTENFSKWKWQDGKLIIQLNEEQLEQTAGFIIQTN